MHNASKIPHKHRRAESKTEISSHPCTHIYLLTNVGSLFRHASMNSLKGLLKSPNKVGGLFFGMRNRTLIGCISELGGSPLASSIAVMPSDQMSA